MDQFGSITLLLFFLFFFDAGVQAQPSMNDLPQANAFRPSLAIVIGILSIMFALTTLLLLYAKFCHRPSADLFTDADQQQVHGLIRTNSRFSGIDKTVIEALPFFRFSSLQGSRKGLECVVCLSKFEDLELLRLLPKCKHAFHIDCVDRWLESHSSCPLCRHKVAAEDVSMFTYSNSMRFSRNPSDLTEDPDVELFVRREPDNHGSSSRFSIGSSFRKVENRWCDVNSSDLTLLNSEMLGVVSSRRLGSAASAGERFSATGLFDNGSSSNEPVTERRRLIETKVTGINRSYSVSDSKFGRMPDLEENQCNTSRLLVTSGKRSMSEITNLSRFANFGLKTGREQPQYTRQPSNV